MNKFAILSLFWVNCLFGVSATVRKYTVELKDIERLTYNEKIQHIDYEEPIQQNGVIAKTKGMPWPMPQEMSSREDMVFLHPKFFEFNISGNECDILLEALLRYKPPALYAARTRKSSIRNFWENSWEMPPLPILKSLRVNLTSSCEQWPYYGMDEAYTLDVGVADLETATLTSNSIWGILRGLETFTHLFWYGEHGELVAHQTVINDFPRFSHRGVMLDTSRHYLPVSVIKENLDLMAMNKFNTFHWHIVDDQSFPYQSVLFHNLSKLGSYTSDMIYTIDDVKEVIEYARLRGIRVMSEYDTPGHTLSWGPGQPGLLAECYDMFGMHKNGKYGPVDPTKEENYDFMKKFFYEVTTIFPESFVHLGGDEVNMKCWESNPDIRAFMKAQNISNGRDLQEYYIERLMNIVKGLDNKRTILLWQEMFDDSEQLDQDTVVHVWKGVSNYYREVKKVTDRNMKVILSSCWYLNYIAYGTDWHAHYECEPTRGVDDDKRHLIMGGEAAIWGEYVDDTNLIQRLWPRASAVAERLWSSEKLTSVQDAIPRIEEQRCRLLGRGYKAEPINGPGFCA